MTAHSLSGIFYSATRRTKNVFLFFSQLYLYLVTKGKGRNVYVFLSAYRVVLALLGKCAVALVFIVMYMWSSELYPTVVRYEFQVWFLVVIIDLWYKRKEKEKSSVVITIICFSYFFKSFCSVIVVGVSNDFS